MQSKAEYIGAWLRLTAEQTSCSGLWFEYDLVGKTATNEKPRPDIGKGVLLHG